MDDMDKAEIVRAVARCWRAAKDGRDAAIDNREAIWRSNVDLAWNRFDFSNKQDWQAQYALPEGSLYVDRWCSAMREALMQPSGWYSVSAEIAGDQPDPGLAIHIKAFMDVWLEKVGTDSLGRPLAYASVFEEQVKLAAMMAACGSVVWDPTEKRVRIHTIDPRELMLDPTGRGVYRVWSVERDRFDVLAEAKRSPRAWDVAAVEEMTSWQDPDKGDDRERLTGQDDAQDHTRNTVTLRYFYGVLLNDLGEPFDSAAPQLVVTGNDHYLLQAPRRNPAWHGRDWMVFAPAINMPLSLYGKSYMETWAETARLYVSFTNVLLDAAYMGSIKSFAVARGALARPEQLDEGIYPGKIWEVDDFQDASKVISAFDLGGLSPADMNAIQMIKAQLREDTSTNDIALGQTPQKGDITATEIVNVQQAGNALIKSIANTIETRVVEQHLDLVFRTALQHFDAGDVDLRRRLGNDVVDMFDATRRQFATSNVIFTVRGISGLLERASKLRGLLGTLQTVAQNPQLTQAFLARYDINAVLDQLFELGGVDASKLQQRSGPGGMMIGQDGAPMPPTPEPPGPQGSPPKIAGAITGPGTVMRAGVSPFTR